MIHRPRNPLPYLLSLLPLLLITPALAATFDVVPPASQASYRVREQLAGISFPNDAVGTTTGVTGSVGFDTAGDILADSLITVDVSQLTSDQNRRDNFLRNSSLETARHPTVTFVPTAVTAVDPAGATWDDLDPDSGRLTFAIVGELTIRAVTRTVTWQAEATREGDLYRLQASTTFTFDYFDMTRPRAASVLSVADDITLEIDLAFARRAE